MIGNFDVGVFMMSDKEPEKAVEHGQLRTCPMCNCVTNVDLESCPVCGCELEIQGQS
jgi:hypothetical protein